MLRYPQTLTNKPHFPYSATSSRGVASFLLFWRNNAHSQGKWIHFCSQVSIFIYIYTEILGTSDLALPSASSPGESDKSDLTFYFFVCVCIFINNLPRLKWPFYRDCATTNLRCCPAHRTPEIFCGRSDKSGRKIWEIRTKDTFRLRWEGKECVAVCQSNRDDRVSLWPLTINISTC